MLKTGSTFYIVAAGVIDENTPHHLGRNGKKMGSILPLHALVIHQTQVGFVHQGAGLERMARALALHIIVRQATELLINDGRQVVECVLVSIAPMRGAACLSRLCPPRQALPGCASVSRDYTAAPLAIISWRGR